MCPEPAENGGFSESDGARLPYCQDTAPLGDLGAGCSEWPDDGQAVTGPDLDALNRIAALAAAEDRAGEGAGRA